MELELLSRVLVSLLADFQNDRPMLVFNADDMTQIVYTMIGITEYTVADIYDYIQKHEERAFVFKFSAMEIYNEAVKGLLSTGFGDIPKREGNRQPRSCWK